MEEEEEEDWFSSRISDTSSVITTNNVPPVHAESPVSTHDDDFFSSREEDPSFFAQVNPEEGGGVAGDAFSDFAWETPSRTTEATTVLPGTTLPKSTSTSADGQLVDDDFDDFFSKEEPAGLVSDNREDRDDFDDGLTVHPLPSEQHDSSAFFTGNASVQNPPNNTIDFNAISALLGKDVDDYDDFGFPTTTTNNNNNNTLDSFDDRKAQLSSEDSKSRVQQVQLSSDNQTQPSTNLFDSNEAFDFIESTAKPLAETNVSQDHSLSASTEDLDWGTPFAKTEHSSETAPAIIESDASQGAAITTNSDEFRIEGREETESIQASLKYHSEQQEDSDDHFFDEVKVENEAFDNNSAVVNENTLHREVEEQLNIEEEIAKESNESSAAFTEVENTNADTSNHQDFKQSSFVSIHTQSDPGATVDEDDFGDFKQSTDDDFGDFKTNNGDDFGDFNANTDDDFDDFSTFESGTPKTSISTPPLMHQPSHVSLISTIVRFVYL